MNGLNKRKFRSLSTCMMVGALAAAPLAYGAPGGGTEITQFRSYSYGAGGDSCDDNGCRRFSAFVYDDLGGVPQGGISATYTQLVWYEDPDPEYPDYSGWYYESHYIACYGPAYANVVSVNGGNGNAIVHGTLDPASPDCGYPWNVSAPVTVNFSGRGDGTFRTSTHGVGTSRFVRYDGTIQTDKFNSQDDTFNRVVFTGTNGFGTDTITIIGGSYISLRLNRQQLK